MMQRCWFVRSCPPGSPYASCILTRLVSGAIIVSLVDVLNSTVLRFWWRAHDFFLTVRSLPNPVEELPDAGPWG